MKSQLHRLQEENTALVRGNTMRFEVMEEPDAQLLIALQMSALDNDRLDPESIQLAMALQNSSIQSTRRLPQANYHLEATSNDICPLCAESFYPGEPLVRLPCKHYYHSPCAQTWFQDHGVCAICDLGLDY